MQLSTPSAGSDAGVLRNVFELQDTYLMIPTEKTACLVCQDKIKHIWLQKFSVLLGERVGKTELVFLSYILR